MNERIHLLPLLLLGILLLGGSGLPPQPDLDLPILPENYDPRLPRSGPVPPGPPETPPDEGEDDPRDEPPPTFFGEEIESESDSIFYVIDFSCSMGRGDREEKAKAEFARSVSGLPPSMRFNVLVYGCQLTLWSPSSRRADEPNKQAAISFVEGRHPSSGTGTGPAVGLALRTDLENKTIILLTDGQPNCGADDVEGHRAMIRRLNVQAATINVFGIEARDPWRAFCVNVAADSGGAYFDVP